MNIRTIAASALVLAALASGAVARTSNFINTSGVSLSETEKNYAIGHRMKQDTFALKAFGKALAVAKVARGTGDYLDETSEEANQRSSNR
jgi:hypothetical protein